MKKYLNEYALRQASIFELRNIAREMGVNSPTIYNKDSLVEKILKIMNGEEKPQMPKSRQGRPPKKSISDSNYTLLNNGSKEDLNIVSFKDLLASEQPLPEDEQYDFSKPSTGGNWLIASPGFVYGEENNNPLKLDDLKGYFLVVDKGYGYIFEPGRISNVDNVVFVPENYVNGYGFRSGDKINCSSRTVASTGTKYLAMVKDIDGITEVGCARINFEELELDLTTEQEKYLTISSDYAINIGIDKLPIGTRNVILTPTLRNYGKLLNSFENLDKDYCIINLCLDALPEDIYLFKNKTNFENFYTIFGDSEKQNNIAINLAISRAKRLAEKNKKVILIVNELKKVIKYQNFSLGYNAEDLKYKSLNNCYSLLTLSRNLKNESSITVCALCKTDNNSSFEKSLISELDNMNCTFYRS